MIRLRCPISNTTTLINFNRNNGKAKQLNTSIISKNQILALPINQLNNLYDSLPIPKDAESAQVYALIFIAYWLKSDLLKVKTIPIDAKELAQDIIYNENKSVVCRNMQCAYLIGNNKKRAENFPKFSPAAITENQTIDINNYFTLLWDTIKHGYQSPAHDDIAGDFLALGESKRARKRHAKRLNKSRKLRQQSIESAKEWLSSFVIKFSKDDAKAINAFIANSEIYSVIQHNAAIAKITELLATETQIARCKSFLEYLNQTLVNKIQLEQAMQESDNDAYNKILENLSKTYTVVSDSGVAKLNSASIIGKRLQKGQNPFEAIEGKEVIKAKKLSYNPEQDGLPLEENFKNAFSYKLAMKKYDAFKTGK